MGYHTDFTGQFKVSPALEKGHKEFLTAFSQSRRMQRNPIEADRLSDPVRNAVGLPIGEEGGYFVGGTGDFGQAGDKSVVEHNSPPSGQPGLWCQWTPNENGDTIKWDEGEKFYHFTKWLEYIIQHFLTPWGYHVNGEIKWAGEDYGDTGVITVENNVVSRENDLT